MLLRIYIIHIIILPFKFGPAGGGRERRTAEQPKSRTAAHSRHGAPPSDAEGMRNFRSPSEGHAPHAGDGGETGCVHVSLL